MIHSSISNRKLTDIALNLLREESIFAREKKTNRKRIEEQKKKLKKQKNYSLPSL